MKKLIIIFIFFFIAHVNLMSQTNYEDYVWSIVKIEVINKDFSIFNNNYNGDVSILGTCFPINDSLFVTAYHCYKAMGNSKLLNGELKTVLVNYQGEVIQEFEVFQNFETSDISILKIKNKLRNKKYLFLDNKFIPNTEVVNVGYPGQITWISDADIRFEEVPLEKSKDIINNNIFQQNNILGLTYSPFSSKKIVIYKLKVSKPIMSSGKIESFCENCTYDSMKAKVKDANIIRLSYLSCPGFSGGPLINKKSKKILGVVSFLDATNEFKLCAIALKDLLDLD